MAQSTAHRAAILMARVLRVEQLEPLGLAIQMYCLHLRCLVCNYDGTGDLMKGA